MRSKRGSPALANVPARYRLDLDVVEQRQVIPGLHGRLQRINALHRQLHNRINPRLHERVSEGQELNKEWGIGQAILARAQQPARLALRSRVLTCISQ